MFLNHHLCMYWKNIWFQSSLSEVSYRMSGFAATASATNSDTDLNLRHENWSSTPKVCSCGRWRDEHSWTNLSKEILSESYSNSRRVSEDIDCTRPGVHSVHFLGIGMLWWESDQTQSWLTEAIEVKLLYCRRWTVPAERTLLQIRSRRWVVWALRDLKILMSVHHLLSLLCWTQ